MAEKPQVPENSFPLVAVTGRGGVLVVGLTREECTLRLRARLGGGKTVPVGRLLAQHGLSMGPCHGRPLFDATRAERNAASKDPTALMCVVKDYTEKDARKTFGVSVTTANLWNSALASGRLAKGASFPGPNAMIYPFSIVTA